MLEGFNRCRLVEASAPFALAYEEFPFKPVCGDDIDVGLFTGIGVGSPPAAELERGEREASGNAFSPDPLQADVFKLLADIRGEGWAGGCI